MKRLNDMLDDIREYIIFANSPPNFKHSSYMGIETFEYDIKYDEGFQKFIKLENKLPKWIKSFLVSIRMIRPIKMSIEEGESLNVFKHFKGWMNLINKQKRV
jgi:hypothetical protein